MFAKKMRKGDKPFDPKEGIMAPARAVRIVNDIPVIDVRRVGYNKIIYIGKKGDEILIESYYEPVKLEQFRVKPYETYDITITPALGTATLEASSRKPKTIMTPVIKIQKEVIASMHDIESMTGKTAPLDFFGFWPIVLEKPPNRVERVEVMVRGRRTTKRRFVPSTSIMTFIAKDDYTIRTPPAPGEFVPESVGFIGVTITLGKERIE